MAVSGSPKSGRDYIIPQLAVYTTYIPLCILPSGGLYNPYHLLGEPEIAIELVEVMAVLRLQVRLSFSTNLRSADSQIYLSKHSPRIAWGRTWT